ncbi:MAG: response regulator, partial [Saprospiraceae bacterium]
MIRTMIIEDEIASQNLLKTIIEDYCPKLELIGIASTVPESQLLIDKLKPELVFLDINLKGRNAFELLEIIKGRKFKIIFTTASQEYAMQAFKVEAIDYILKPYNPKDIIRATSRIK